MGGGNGEGPGPGGSRPLLRVPHVLTTLDEVHAAVEKLLASPHFVIDIESREKIKDAPNPRTNEVTWVGLGCCGQTYLIPMGHPKGPVLKARHKEKTAACLLFPADDPRAFTKLGKPSMRMVEHTVEATYAKPIPQLYPSQVFEALEPLLFSDRGKIGHNVKYDLLSIAKYFAGRIPPGPYHDTILIRHCLSENLGLYDLKTLVCTWFEIPLHKRKTFYPNLGGQGVDNFGIDEVARYLAKDVRYCWMMFQKWYPMLKRKGMQAVYDFEMSVYPVLMAIEDHGFPIDKSGLGEVREELETRIAEIEQQCYIMAGGEFPLSNSDTKRWVMFGEGDAVCDAATGAPLRSQKLRVRSRTPENQLPQVTKAVLQVYANRGNHMAEWLLEWSALEKLRGTFVTGLDNMLVANGNGLQTIHTSFKQHGTVTGRFSSTKPNLQQMPRGSKIRKLFVAGTGHVLIVADYDQIELRCLAKEANERNMIDTFLRGVDIHKAAAASMYRIALESVDDNMRQTGKTANFGTAYGAGPERIAAVAGVPVKEGEKFLERYYAGFPGLLPWKARMIRAAKARGDRANIASQPPYVVIPPIGRYRRLPELFELEDWKRWHAERQAINAIIQGMASYITKLAMLRLDQDLRDLPAQMVVQVHDELAVRVDERYVDDVLALVVEGMSDVRDQDGLPILGEIPLLVSANVGYSWSDAKGK